MKGTLMSDHHLPRRRFLEGAAAASSAWAASTLAASPDPTAAPSEKSHAAALETDADVLVVGGGTAGAIAAIQAGRAGAQTVLVERSSQLGGTATTGGVAFPGLFHAWGKQVIAGIGWELVARTVELDGGRLPDFATPPPPRAHWLHQVLINPYLYAALAEEACLKQRVAICYDEFPLSVQRSADRWLVEVVGPGIRRKVRCRQIIDCTGGADIVGMLGFARLREKETQPGSMLFKIGSQYRAGRDRLDGTYVLGADSSSSVTRTQANIAGRQAVLKELRRRLARGDKEARLVHLQPEAAVRESYRILGEVVITHADYVSGRRFEDAVCHAFYPVDLHTSHGVAPKPLEQGVVPTVPLRALVPKGSHNLLVAGRSASSDRLANSGLRVQATAMAMGQAAGAVAALACRLRKSPIDVPMQEIRELLRQHGAIVPEATDAS